MKTKINCLVIVNQQGTSQYHIGNSYKGLFLSKIEDKSIEYPDAFHSIYQGFTPEGDLVFEAINAPIEVRYETD